MIHDRPPGFTYRNDALHCERLKLRSLAAKHGTPLYVYSSQAIRERFRILDEAFSDLPHTICYSVKANSNLSILRLLAGLGAGFDIVSGGELQRVRFAGPKAQKRVVFSGVGKTEDELMFALRKGILLFNIESESELALLAACARKLKKTAQVAFRVNPDVPAETHPYISTGQQEHKFGVPFSAAEELYRRAAAEKYLRVAGVSVHIGSQICEVTPFRQALERVAGLVSQLFADGHDIRFIDAGGGLGIPYQGPSEQDFQNLARRYAQAITLPLRSLKRMPHLLLEPGRSIIAPAGALLTRVLYQKRNGSKRFTIVDAAMNDLIRPALYGARHEILPVELKPGALTTVSDVAGPVCESGDFLARDAALPELSAGSYLCILDAGAYGMSLASNYNTRPRAAEVLVDGARARVVRRRETLRQLLQSEI